MWMKFSLVVMAIGLVLQISHGVNDAQSDLELPKCYAQSLEARKALLNQPYRIEAHRASMMFIEEDWCHCLEEEYNN